MFYEKVDKSSKIAPELLKKFIWENIEKRVKTDCVELVLSVMFRRNEITLAQALFCLEGAVLFLSEL